MKHLILAILFYLIFSDLCSQTYFLNGDAQYLGGDCYQITTTQTTQNGTVWYGEQIDLEQTFDLSFIMNFGNLDNNGADGICFVLQTVGTAAIGESGGGLGYLNFGTSLGIEFDTYQNGDYADPFYDHIAIERDGDLNHNSINNIAGPVQADVFSDNIEDGEDHVVRITWDPETQEINVYFDCEFRLTGEIDLIEDVFGGVSDVYWGFTAATGGLYNDQIVCLQENIVTSSENVTICGGASATLSAGSSFDGVYTWSPVDYLNVTDQAVVLASPPVSTTYYVEFIDLCGDSNTYEFNIVVEDLEVEIGPIGILNCIETSLTAFADINFQGDPTYSWYLNDQLFLTGEGFSQAIFASGGNAYVIADIQGVCIDTLEFDIETNYEVFLANAGEDLVINCYFPELQVIGSSDSPLADFIWTDNNGANTYGNTIEVDEPGSYVLTVINPESGCEAQDELTVLDDFAVPEIAVQEQDTLSCIQPVVQITGIDPGTQNPFSAIWSTGDGVIVSGIESTSPTVNEPGYYSVEVLDLQNGCSSIAGVFVEEDEELNFDLSRLNFPNVITPNSKDGNEVWRPFLSDDPDKDIAFIFEEFDVVIYNRWGNRVFDSQNANLLWSGADLNEGVYFYHVQYKAFCDDGETKNAEGNIHLLK